MQVNTCLRVIVTRANKVVDAMLCYHPFAARYTVGVFRRKYKESRGYNIETQFIK